MDRQIPVTLFRICSTHSNVRTDTVEGSCTELPSLQKGFTMWGKGLEFGTRLLFTTPILALATVGKSILFQTRNSTYTLLVMED